MKGRGIIIQKRRHNARDSSNNKASDNVFFFRFTATATRSLTESIHMFTHFMY